MYRQRSIHVPILPIPRMGGKGIYPQQHLLYPPLFYPRTFYIFLISHIVKFQNRITFFEFWFFFFHLCVWRAMVGYQPIRVMTNPVLSARRRMENFLSFSWEEKLYALERFGLLFRYAARCELMEVRTFNGERPPVSSGMTRSDSLISNFNMAAYML